MISVCTYKILKAFVFIFKVKQGKAHELCGKEGVECKEGQEKGADEGVFENEDYIYTQSVP